MEGAGLGKVFQCLDEGRLVRSGRLPHDLGQQMVAVERHDVAAADSVREERQAGHLERVLGELARPQLLAPAVLPVREGGMDHVGALPWGVRLSRTGGTASGRKWDEPGDFLRLPPVGVTASGMPGAPVIR
ncbi:hypothetical protein ACFW6Q_06575 [Streptomyces sp. NPDC058737]|uniref:hypothetical protein n=1 Tax=Streptomyces sp. NPDC058737 TaxID=3346617 RepID=UPI0036BDB6CD